MLERLFGLKVSGEKTKPRASSLGGNAERVAIQLQSEVPQSNESWLLIGYGWIKAFRV